MPGGRRAAAGADQRDRSRRDPTEGGDGRGGERRAGEQAQPRGAHRARGDAAVRVRRGGRRRGRLGAMVPASVRRDGARAAARRGRAHRLRACRRRAADWAAAARRVRAGAHCVSPRRLAPRPLLPARRRVRPVVADAAPWRVDQRLGARRRRGPHVPRGRRAARRQRRRRRERGGARADQRAHTALLVGQLRRSACSATRSAPASAKTRRRATTRGCPSAPRSPPSSAPTSRTSTTRSTSCCRCSTHRAAALARRRRDDGDGGGRRRPAGAPPGGGRAAARVGSSQRASLRPRRRCWVRTAIQRRTGAPGRWPRPPLLPPPTPARAAASASAPAPARGAAGGDLG